MNGLRAINLYTPDRFCSFLLSSKSRFSTHENLFFATIYFQSFCYTHLTSTLSALLTQSVNFALLMPGNSAWQSCQSFSQRVIEQLYYGPLYLITLLDLIDYLAHDFIMQFVTQLQGSFIQESTKFHGPIVMCSELHRCNTPRSQIKTFDCLTAQI